MPGKIKVKVLAGRNLPVMDRASDTTDAFVEIKFGGVTHKTDVCRKSLNPHWSNTEWYRFEVDESELQDEPLQLRLMDHDTYSANDAIGKVVISLAPLLARESTHAHKGLTTHPGAVMSGWIPVFDTLHGIRGELNVIVKVELFADFNKYKDSSCGVQFFHCPMIPPGYRATAIHGFVEELVVNDDPEYQWIDKIRTPRASNEARQVAFINLSNQVQRLVGLKAAELGANAVIGYQQDFDLEGEAGVVARAIGTAVNITAVPTPSQTVIIPPCSQQQLKKYLDILGMDNKNIPDLNEYFKTHQEELQKLLNVLHPKYSADFLDEVEVNEDDDKSMDLTRSSIIKGYTDTVSIYQDDYAAQKSMRHLSEDQTDLNKLLNQIEDDSDSDSPVPIQKIKKIKTNFFTKRLGSLRSKKADKPSDDQISIQSNSSDTSRISLTDIKNEFKKLKRLKKPKFARKAFKNPHDEGTGMASILARSVIHAHTSLACIAETQDSEHSPCSTLRRTSESEPNTNVLEEEMGPVTIVTENVDSIQEEVNNKIDTRCSSLLNVNTEPQPISRQRTLSGSCPTTPVAGRSENLLKLPGEVGYFGSVSSALSGDSSEMYSTSEEDDDSSDLKTDTERSFETTSSVVETVLKQEVDPNLIQMIDRKLSVLETVTPEPDATKENEPKPQDIKMDTLQAPEIENDTNQQIEASTSSEKFVRKERSHSMKFTNPFTHKNSVSAPSSPTEKHGFVYRSSRRIRRQLSKISKSSMIKSLSHISLIPKKKHVEAKSSLSQPGSSSDVPSKAPSHETVLGSPFLSYTDLLSLDKDEHDSPKKVFHKSDEIAPIRKVEMYIGSEPASRASVSGPSSPYHGKDDYIFNEEKSHKKDKHLAVKATGLLHTAMETILIDKVQSLLIPTSPDAHPTNATEKQFFDDVNQKLELVEESRNKDAEIRKVKEKLDRIEQDSFPKTAGDSIDDKQSDLKRESQGLETENTKDIPSEITAVENALDSIEEPKVTDPQPPPNRSNHNKLQRQDSIHEHESETPRKMSNEITLIPLPSKNQPMLQHFHPLLSGPLLETIPSLPDNTSFTESLDVEGVETNCVSVCVNQHADGSILVDRSEGKDRGSPKHARHESYTGRESMSASSNAQNSSLNATSTPVGMHRRSSDSDLSVTPKGSSLNASGNAGSGGGAILRPSMNSNNLELLEYPFLTMTECPPGLIVHIGGCVCARSVKLVDGGGESAARAAWWAELRTELRAHARALRCNAVIAYTENTAICEDVCVLSASGTAAVINLDCDFNADLDASLAVAAAQNGSKSTIEEVELESCGIAHVPYSPGTGPNRAELSHCGGCRRARVPSVLLATCAQPGRLASHAKAVTITAVAARVRRAPPQSEPGARDISDQLPFLEYELHKLLLAKLRMQGANAIFNLQTQIAVGERCVMALASGTAVRLGALPPPTPPRIKASENDKAALEIQKALWDTFNANKTANGYDTVAELGAPVSEVVAESEEPPALHLSADKDAALLELDETEDVETARVLASRRTHMQVYRAGMRPAVGAPPHAFAQVWRARFAPPGSGGGGATAAADRHVARALEGVAYKLRRLKPCALLAPRFQLELPEGVAYKLRRLKPCALLAPRFQLELPEDEIQLILSGAAIQLADPFKPEPNGLLAETTNNNYGQSSQGNGQGNGHGSHGDADDDIFALDEEEVARKEKDYAETEKVLEEKAVATNGQVPTTVSLTSLCYVTGARIVRRVCALRLLFVRETTAVRELGGLSGFLHTFTCEVLAIVRAYTAALGGNTLTSLYITQLMLQDNAHKNQGQCLLSVGGDVVHITY